MSLTKSERRNLQLYERYRDAPPTLWGLIKLNLLRYLVSALLVFLLYQIAPGAGLESLALIVIGLFIGSLVRELAHFWRFVRFWPTQSAVMDWQRVEDLLVS